MTERPRKPLFPNPFYVVVLVSGTAFVVTALAYLVSGLGFSAAAGAGAVERGRASRAMAAWFDRNGPLALGVEFVIMLVFSLLAMVTDHWFSAKTRANGPDSR